ncbi:Rad3-related DNA helicase [Ferrimonas marina]|uniref:Rad3-related DNA helicase n=2 Tax=Ferrimonas marina TaxID=299255 RepID=A0A1M5TYI3_9GAMM|nr:Rad3-related DNA helicase [Ferrimonas marina]
MTFREELGQIFGPGGWLETEYGFSSNAHQMAYAKAVLSALDSGDAEKPLNMLEAETGTGKTLAYLFAMALVASSGKRGVISTYTLSLQEQILYQEWPKVERYLNQTGRAVSIGRLISRLNYVSPARVADALEDLFGSIAAADAPYHELLDWAASSAAGAGTGLISEYVDKYGNLPDGISNDSICVPQHREPDNDMYGRDRADSESHDILLISHAMLHSSSFSWSQEEPASPLARLRPDLMLFDEADQLATVCESTVESHIRPATMRAKLRRITRQMPHLGVQSDLIQSQIETIETILNGRYQGEGSRAVLLEMSPDEQLFKPLAEHTLQVSTLLKRIGKSRKADRVSEEVMALNQYASMLRDFGEQSTMRATGICWSPVRHRPSLFTHEPSRAASLSRVIRSYTKRQATPPRVVLTSATLSDVLRPVKGSATAKDFQSLLARLWLRTDEVGQAARFSPLKFGSVNGIFLPDMNAPRPFLKEMGGALNPEWPVHCAETIRQHQEHGPMLALTTSYAEQEAIMAQFEPDALLGRRDEPLSLQVAKFRRDGGVLISPALWEGYNLRREDGTQLIATILITRFPFSPSSDIAALAQNRIARLQGRAVSTSTEYAINAERGAKKMRQGFGRGIRHPLDCIRLVICDPRFPQAKSGRSVGPFKAWYRVIPARFLGQWETAQIGSASSQEPEQPGGTPLWQTL